MLDILGILPIATPPLCALAFIMCSKSSPLQHKNCEKKMQELTNSIKRPNFRIMGIEEGK
jgi:hypothetical protein